SAAHVGLLATWYVRLFSSDSGDGATAESSAVAPSFFGALRKRERVEVVAVLAGRLERERGSSVIDRDVLLSVDAVGHTRRRDIRCELGLPQQAAVRRVVGVELARPAAREDEPTGSRERAAIARPRPLHTPGDLVRRNVHRGDVALPELDPGEVDAGLPLAREVVLVQLDGR